MHTLVQILLALAAAASFVFGTIVGLNMNKGWAKVAFVAIGLTVLLTLTVPSPETVTPDVWIDFIDLACLAGLFFGGKRHWHKGANIYMPN